MYAFIENNLFVRWVDLKKDYPNTSFPISITQADLPDGVVIVYQTAAPTPGLYQVVEQNPVPSFINGKWQIEYYLREMTEAEKELYLANYAISQDQLRLEAYRNESDPLFFKYQRGEATQEQWLSTVEEIKQRYPKQP
jgi:hypothetical protein